MQCVRFLVLLAGMCIFLVDCRYRDLLIKRDSFNNCNGDGRVCSLEPFRIDFRTTFGSQFESILWPTQVNIGRCRGTCDQSRVGGINIPRSKNESICCAPIKYEDFSILLYQGNNELVMKSIQGVKISECGCA